jgi:hypothetical protein
LKTGEAFIRLPDDSVHKVSTTTLPSISVHAEEVQEVRETYLTRYFVPVDERSVVGDQKQATMTEVEVIGRRSRQPFTVFDALERRD